MLTQIEVNQVRRHMRTGAINDHENQVRSVGETDLRQQLGHALGVHLPTGHPLKLALDGTGLTVDIDELSPLAIAHLRSFWAGCPTAANPHHATFNISRLHKRTQSSGGFFSIPTATEGRSWGAGCLVPPYASRGAFDTRRRPQWDAPDSAPMRREAVRQPRHLQRLSHPANVRRSHAPPMWSARHGGGLPNLVAQRRACRTARAVCTAASGRSPVRRQAPVLFAPDSHPAVQVVALLGSSALLSRHRPPALLRFGLVSTTPHQVDVLLPWSAR